MSLVSERTAQPKTSDRGVALLKFTLELLKSHPEGMRPQDIFREIEAKLPLDSFDTEPMKGSGLPRWLARQASLGAGLLPGAGDRLASFSMLALAKWRPCNPAQSA